MSRYRVAAPPAGRPLLIFDGDCGFCRLWIDRWRAMTGDRVDYAPSQEVASRFPEIPPEVFSRTVVFVTTGGDAITGAEAVFHSLSYAPVGTTGFWLYRHVPGVAPIAELLYATIASRRRFFSRMTRLLWGRDVKRPSYGVARYLFLRMMGVVYLIAFVSLWTQIEGLIGSGGILPVAPWIDAASHGLGPERYWHYPTLCWLDASDAFLQIQCGAGVLLALVVALGIAPAPCFALLWVLYLSVTVACRDFLGFQWDNLLLEAGLLSIFLSPLRWRFRLGDEPAPARLPLALVHWLAFRLMFSSGVMKLSSGDANWKNLTALTYHYQTQCLPPWTAWYAHHLPVWLHKVSCFCMFAIELGAPFLVLAPRRLRHLGSLSLIALQVAIMTTGNYGFFNLLTIALCLTWLDDTIWPRRWLASPPLQGRARLRRPGWPIWVMAPIAAVIFVVGAVRLGEAFRTRLDWPAPVDRLVGTIAPIRSVNRYGLFSVMTTSRPEVIIEGSNDGADWRPYEFKWKPGDVTRRPPFVSPHMPRLDWQMWFAALDDYRQHPWFLPFMARLLEGSPETLALLERNPFPGAPPRYVRGVLYDYEFTDRATRLATGAWWRRKALREYSPVFSRRDE